MIVRHGSTNDIQFMFVISLVLEMLYNLVQCLDLTMMAKDDRTKVKIENKIIDFSSFKFERETNLNHVFFIKPKVIIKSNLHSIF